MDHVKTLLSKVLQRRGLLHEADAAHATHLAKAWIVEHLPDVAQFLHVRALKDGILSISSDHSIAAQECSEARLSLLSDLQRDCPSAGVREIRVSRSF